MLLRKEWCQSVLWLYLGFLAWNRYYYIFKSAVKYLIDTDRGPPLYPFFWKQRFLSQILKAAANFEMLLSSWARFGEEAPSLEELPRCAWAEASRELTVSRLGGSCASVSKTIWELRSSSEVVFSVIQRFYLLTHLNSGWLKTWEGLVGAKCWTSVATCCCEYDLRWKRFRDGSWLTSLSVGK